MFNFQQHLPPPDLRPWVRLFWSLSADAGAGDGAGALAAPAVELVVPDGHPELIFNFGDPFAQRAPGETSFREQPRVILNGQIRTAIELRSPRAVRLVGIRLQPWALGALVRVPAHELTNQWHALGDVSRVLLPALHDALSECRGTHALFNVVGSHLRQAVAGKVAPSAQLVAAVSALAGNDALHSLRRLRGNTGVSERTLQRLFTNEVGLSAAQFNGIARMQRALHLRRQNARVTWAHAAIGAGYYDQSHFNKDFRSLVGCAPTEFMVEPASLTEQLLESPTRN